MLEVWPENWEIVQIFQSVETKWGWVVGLGVIFRAGILPGAIDEAVRMKRIPPRRWPEIYDGVLLMERETIMLESGRRKS